MSQRRALIVFGMHRSGTSALARVLALRGARLPAHPMPSNHGNPAGYWEPAQIVDFNDEVLDYFGVGWDDPFAGFQVPASSVIPARFHARARELLRSEFGNSRLFVLKDPRITLLHDFWFDILGKSRIAACPVVIMRRHEEVAESLQNRDGSSPESSALLYVAYGLELADALDGRLTTCLTYEQVLSDWGAATDRVALQHGFAWAKPDASTRREIDGFLRPGSARGKGVKLPPKLEQWASTVWRWFSAKANGESPDIAPLRIIRAELAGASETIAPVLAERRRRLGLLAESRAIAESSRDLGQAALEVARVELDNVAGERDGLLSERDRLRVANLEVSDVLLRLRAFSNGLEIQLGGLKTHLTQQDDELFASRRLQSELESERDALVSARAQAEAERDLAGAGRLEAEAMRDALLVQSEKAETERQALAVERDRLQVEGEAQASAIEELLRECDLLAAARDHLEAECETHTLAQAAMYAERDGLLFERDELLSERDELASERDRLRVANIEVSDVLLRLRAFSNGLEIQVGRLKAHLTQQDDELVESRRLQSELASKRDALALERGQLSDERDRSRILHQAVVTELAQLQARESELGALAGKLQTEVARLHGEHSRLSDDLREAHSVARSAALELEGAQSHLEATQKELVELKRTRLTMSTEIERRNADLDAARNKTWLAQETLTRIYGSRSWRITSPLRQLSKVADGLLAIGARTTRVKLPALGSDEESTLPGQRLLGLPEPAYSSRPHAGLRAFLLSEFGPGPAMDVLRRMDRFRLPVLGQALRPAAKVECSLDEVRYWSASIGRIAAARTLVDDVAPDVSIVIPVFNQVAFTLACVEALIAHRSRYRFEILIGDDASTDPTEAAFAAPIPGLAYIRHPANSGFVHNCNTTASRARGRYLVLLNNDTQVLPGWLDELIDVLAGNASVGLVGSKLIYPDGKLQECGGIVWSDGSAHNVGRGQEPRSPEYCYLRGTDFVSGASIALPTAVWRQVGGFDEMFAPAYAEDVDLAFRVRAAGLYTLVQPLSQLLHFEGVSSGTDPALGVKSHQEGNLKKLYGRWAGVLAGHRRNADRPELEKERDSTRRLLFVDTCTLTPIEDAGSLVALEIIKSFRRQGFKVTFIPEDNFAHMGEDTRVLQRLGIETIYHPAYSRMGDFLAARDDPFDIILIHRFSVGDRHMAALRARFPHAKVIFLACDLHYLRELRAAELVRNPAAIALAMATKRRELAVIRASDVAMVYSEVECELLAVEAPETQIVLFPLVHDPVETRRALVQRDGVCFVGGYRHAPNVDAIGWFVDQVWPLVRQRCPSQLLYIAGSHMPPEIEALGSKSGIQIVGFVEDMPDFLAARRVNVAPLRYGAGVKGKVAASLAHGVPTVCTPVAAEGMQLTAGVNVLVGETPVELADQLAELLTDDQRWHAISDAGLAYADEITSRVRAERRVCSMLELMDKL